MFPRKLRRRCVRTVRAHCTSATISVRCAEPRLATRLRSTPPRHHGPECGATAWFCPMSSRRFPNVFLKEEGANPTSTFKARGLALAVTMARHDGLKKLAVPSAGNAAGALAAYAAAAGIE